MVKAQLTGENLEKKTQSCYQKTVLLIAELEPAAVLAAHFSCLGTHIQNTL